MTRDLRSMRYIHGLLIILILMGFLIQESEIPLVKVLSFILGYVLTSFLLFQMFSAVIKTNQLEARQPSNVEMVTPDKEDLALYTLNILGTILDIRDHYTYQHSSNVAVYALAVAKSMNLSDEECRHIYSGCMLHDLGKMYIPDEILRKPGRLTEAEYNVVKEHPTKGFQSISELGVFENTIVPNIILYHHERVDGTGYPKGLVHHEIPLEARIVALCDAYDSMTTTRSYRKAMPSEKAIEIIKDNVGRQFDSVVAEHFIKCIHKGDFHIGDSIFSTDTYKKTS